MAVEAQKVASFVFDALMADNGPGGVATLLGGRIYRDQVPAPKPPPAPPQLPAATVGVVSSVDSSTLGAVRVLDTVLVDVRVVGSGASYGPINPAADRVDAVLQNKSGTSDGVYVVELRRDQTQLFIENEAGVSYTHCVQTFRTECYALP